jgi:hypothetical protein
MPVKLLRFIDFAAPTLENRFPHLVKNDDVVGNMKLHPQQALDSGGLKGESEQFHCDVPHCFWRDAREICQDWRARCLMSTSWRKRSVSQRGK